MFVLGVLSQLAPITFDAPTRQLKFGGELRERAEFVSAANVAAGDDADGYLLQRLLLNADLQWDGVRVFAQLGHHDQFDREPAARPTDVDYADTRQLFVDVPLASGDTNWLLRGGRQEIAFGASRLIGVRDGPNIRLTFDGLRADVRHGAWSATAIAVHPAENTPGDFDDGTDHRQSLLGLHTSYGAAPLSWRSDIYYFDSRMDDMRFDAVSGDEHRQTLGFRFYGKRGNWDSDVELILQGGDIAGEDIRAFALATDNGITFDTLPWKPRLGVRTDIISGDRDADDGKLGTFNALYPTGGYFSEAVLLAQANLLDVALSLAVKPRADVSVAWSFNPLWRYSTEDALYRLPLAPQIAGDSSDARYIGLQNQLLATWQLSPALAVRVALVRFNAGDFVQQADGNDLDYAQCALLVKF